MMGASISFAWRSADTRRSARGDLGFSPWPGMKAEFEKLRAPDAVSYGASMRD
jgi:hypothetical protein